MAKKDPVEKAIERSFDLARAKTHSVWRCKDSETHTLVTPKTASDHRAWKNTVRDIRGLAHRGCSAAWNTLKELGERE